MPFHAGGDGSPRPFHWTTLVLQNGVALAGVAWAGWSAATLLSLYWIENLVLAFANTARILLHRRFAGGDGHYLRQGASGRKTVGQRSFSSLLTEYTTMAFFFTLGHGVFLAVFIAAGAQNLDADLWRVDWATLKLAALALVVLAAGDLAVDAFSLADRPVSWLRERLNRATGRVVLFHVVIVIGGALMMWRESPLPGLWLLVALKTLFELGANAARAKEATAT